MSRCRSRTLESYITAKPFIDTRLHTSFLSFFRSPLRHASLHFHRPALFLYSIFNDSSLTSGSRFRAAWAARFSSSKCTFRFDLSTLILASVNTESGPVQEKILLTGRHRIADIHCSTCKTYLGWRYVIFTYPRFPLIMCAGTGI